MATIKNMLILFLLLYPQHLHIAFPLDNSYINEACSTLKGTYTISAQARNLAGTLSPPSEPLIVKVKEP
jgi:hypothetical protein